MEDPVVPEDVGWFQVFRQETSAPLAMGELFVNRQEWLPLVANRWIDFIRYHISAVGGLNMGRKIAHICEFFNVRTAWHGLNNVDPNLEVIRGFDGKAGEGFSICRTRRTRIIRSTAQSHFRRWMCGATQSRFPRVKRGVARTRLGTPRHSWLFEACRDDPHGRRGAPSGSCAPRSEPKSPVGGYLAATFSSISMPRPGLSFE